MLRPLSLLFIAFFFFSAVAGAQPASSAVEEDLLSRPHLRKEFNETRQDSRKTEELITALEQTTGREWDRYPAYVFAYYSALVGLRAKFSVNPFTKISCLRRSIRMLDEAVARAEDDMDVRFVRFACLQSFPNMMGVPGKRSWDVEPLCAMLKARGSSRFDKSLRLETAQWLLKSDQLTPEQREEISVVLKDISGESP